MSQHKREQNLLTPRKLRFRRESKSDYRVEDLFDSDGKRSSSAGSATAGRAQKEEGNDEPQEEESFAFMDFFKVEMTRGYMLEHDEERYAARRQKIYSFMRIPRDLERFIVYGIMQCADSFLYIHTFLPVRFALAMWGLITRPIASCFGFRRRTQRLLTPAEICDILKSIVWLACILIMISVDTNRVYHIIKSQSIIKLYIFYNMLEVGDRLLSAFGQDTMDALFWTATEPKNSKREHFGLLAHMVFTLIYIILHTTLIMFQTTTLNVALNSNNKALLTIMMSNNFVELKGSVFKKFDKNNLFQLTCSDVRERFHLSVLLFIVMIQTMKEFDWSLAQFCVMLPDCFAVLLTEVLVDWIKHAFITRFNELPECIYREYTTSLAYDMTQTRQKHAFSDHSDLVARRMGFIPFPLGVVLIKAIYSAVSFDSIAAWILLLMAYLFALGLRICLTICALGKACKLMKEHQDEKNSSTPSSMTNVPHVNMATNTSIPGVTTLPRAASNLRQRGETITTATSAAGNHTYQRSVTLDNSTYSFALPAHYTSTPKQNTSMLLSDRKDVELDVTNSLELGATALFSNSDVDLDDVRLNENVLETGKISTNPFVEEELARSEPDLFQPQQHQQQKLESIIQQNGGGNCANATANSSASIERPHHVPKRTHKRSESEPFMPSAVGDTEKQV